MAKIKIKKTIPVVYCGSLLQQNFGESVSKHGFLSWDIKGRSFEEHDIKTEHGFYQFKIDSLEDIENDNEKLING